MPRHSFVPGRTFVANTLTARQRGIEIEIWEQAGPAEPRMTANDRVDEAGLIRGPALFALRAGSPVNIDIEVDAEGTVHLARGGADQAEAEPPSGSASCPKSKWPRRKSPTRALP